jgi:hypothetical protein
MSKIGRLLRFCAASPSKGLSLSLFASLATLSACQNPLGSSSVDPLFAPGVAGIKGLEILGSNEVSVNTCSGPYKIEAYDTAGNVTAVPVDLPLNLSGEGTGSFYLDSGCSVVLPSHMSFPTEASEVDFYYEASSPQSTIFDVSSSDLGIIAGALEVTVQGGPIFYTVTPSGTNVGVTPSSVQTVLSGATETFTVTANSGYTTLSDLAQQPGTMDFLVLGFLKTSRYSLSGGKVMPMSVTIRTSTFAQLAVLMGH